MDSRREQLINQLTIDDYLNSVVDDVIENFDGYNTENFDADKILNDAFFNNISNPELLEEIDINEFVQDEVMNFEPLDLNVDAIPISDEHNDEIQQQKNEQFSTLADQVQPGYSLIDYIRQQPTYEDYDQTDRFHRHFYTTQYQVLHSLKTRQDLVSNQQEIDQFFLSFMYPHINDQATRERNDIISVSITNDNMKPFYHPPRRVSNFNKNDFLNSLLTLSQSNTDVSLQGKFTVKVKMVRNITGYGKKRKAPQTISERATNKRSVVKIETRDEDIGRCGHLALVVAKTRADFGPKDKRYLNIRKIYNTRLNAAFNLSNEIGLDWNRPLNLDDLDFACRKLKDYQFKVFSSAEGEIIYQTPVMEKQIIYEFDRRENGHFNVIVSQSGYRGDGYYCNYCNSGFDRKGRHWCVFTCKNCFEQPPCSSESLPVTCTECKRSFSGERCYNNHLSSICKYKKYCEKCEKDYTSEEKHFCEKRRCRKCGEYFEVTPHYCMMKPRNVNADNQKNIFVIYDLESTQIFENEKIIHKPNLLVFVHLCDDCYDHKNMEKISDNCEKCGPNYTTFTGDLCVKQFCDFIIGTTAITAEKHKAEVILFAHNSKGYDGHFILKELFKRSFTTTTDIVMAGHKILKIELGNCKFIDSLSFFQMGLDSLPKAFGLKGVKGTFPHEFNVASNYNYVGDLPPLKYYGLDFMTEKKAKEVTEWYFQEGIKMILNNEQFNLKEQLHKYCEQDVRILQQSVMKFRKLIMDIVNIDCFSNAFTLPSLAMQVFTTKFLELNVIGITPIEDYKPCKTYSLKGAAYIMASNKVSILRGGKPVLQEQMVGKHFVDGLMETNSGKVVFEFDGCRYHNCVRCTACNDLSAIERKRLQDATDARNEYILKFGHQLVVQRECELHLLSKEMQRNILFYETRLKTMREIGPLIIRDAFFGGRTQNVYFHYKASDDESIHYYDFKSLYPFVCGNKELPLKHPEVIYPEDNDISKYFGFVKCKVSAPASLHIPVLPVRFDNKLFFPLCTSCLKSYQQKDCDHNEQQRQFIGTWHTEELKLALTKGYKIIEVYCVNHFANTSNDLFAGYVKLFMKYKEESSGFPVGCESEIQKQQYIRDYEINTGVNLDYNSVAHNAGMRTISKLLLNTLWGKFGEQACKPQTKISESYKEYWQLLNRQDVKIIGEVDVSADKVFVKYKELNVTDEINTRKINYAIAASVTAHARVMLYKEIDKIESSRDRRVLYFDTDSIIFAAKCEEYKPKVGQYIGEMTDEIETDYGQYARLVEFVSCGPKNYGLHVKTANGESKHSLKVKGIKLTSKASAVITFEKMIEIAHKYRNGEETEPELVEQSLIYSDLNQDVFTKKYVKKYRAISDKRRIVPFKMYTRPYGYIENRF